jgi:circadian clock protein KaiB
MICDGQLKKNYRIEVIDLAKNPQLARDNQIIAVPTLVRNFPLPVRNIVGDLSNTESVLAGLGLT